MMPILGIASLLALAAAPAAHAPAAAAHAPALHAVRPQDPASLVLALQKAGYPASLASDQSGDPMINSAAKGTKSGAAPPKTKFAVIFYGCTDHRKCTTIQFRRDFTVPQPVTADRLNQWNSSQRFGRAFHDSNGDVALAMDMDLDHGGVAPALFIDNVEFWLSIAPKFIDFVGYPGN
jgi:hypothetical protein